jgi:ABC-type Fe3+/spermidine/putrescine transport system ATPase subunit
MSLDQAAVLRLEGVGKRYEGSAAIGPIDLSVGKGEFLTLLGPSGCGKTTTLHIIAGLVKPTQGRLILAGREITELAPPYRDVGLVFQNYALFPHRTIAENVAFGLRMRKVGKSEIAERVSAMLGLVGLTGVEGRMPHQLSGGQRQRVALARALVIAPSILLLDEPLSNLDALLRKRMRFELRDIQRRLGITTVFVTHDQDEAFEMSDRIVLMNGGHIEQIGTPEDIYDRPVTRFAAEFIGEASLLQGRVVAVEGDDVLIEAGGLSVRALAMRAGLAKGSPAVLMTRPEWVELSPRANGEASAMRVVKRVFQGDRILFELATRSGETLHCSTPSAELYRGIAAGGEVGARLRECRAFPVG